MIRQLEVSERRYRRLFESAYDGILILEADSGKILDVNPYLLSLLGYQAEELLGKQPWEIGIFADQGANKSRLKELQEHGYIRYKDLPLQTKNQREQIEVEFVSNVYQEGDRDVIQCNIRDIRPRGSKTETAGVGLSRSKRMSDEFLAIISHELRGPLNVVLGWTQILKRWHENPDQMSEGLDAIARSARAQARIVADLLDINRIAFGKLACDSTPLHLVDVVSDAVDDAKFAAEEKGIELQWTRSASADLVNGDTVRLGQIIGNILNNAIKFTPAGGIVEISLVPQKDDVSIRIRDTGRGISPELLPKIFDRFWQADQQIERKYAGLGLGLAIATELVQLHGGSVKAESAGEGQGATFTVTLPLLGKP